MANTWSTQQEAIFGWFKNPTGKNLAVTARAGCGKTTTILEGINRAPEQRIAVLCFNKRNQIEAEAKLTNPNAEALTSHSLGFRSVKRYWENIRVASGSTRVNVLVEEVCGAQAPDPLKRLVGKLCTKGRELAPFATAGDELVDIALQFDCVPDDAWKTDGFDLAWVCDKAVAAIDLAARVKPTAGIDFADMLFLPLRNKWLRPVYDLVVIDEAQDQTLVQLLLAQGACGGRIAVVGDDRQGIYGFRGADSGALGRLERELQAESLSLTRTYRCGKVIVAAAQRLVPDFEAAPTNADGRITTIPRSKLADQVGAGDFILSRTNAPLIGIALGLVRQGRRVKIEGRDIGAGLRAIINKLATGPAKNSIPKFLEKLVNWKEREVERAEKAKLDNKVEQILDQYETLVALIDGVSGIPELLTRLENLFADNVADAPSQIVCSSIHRAKGLESERVFILQDTLNPPVACEGCRKRPKKCACPNGYVPDPQAQREEQNIEYVAITRAKSELVWVSGDAKR
jgi:AAA domain/UvrD-like helicase C-terminal domain